MYHLRNKRASIQTPNKIVFKYTTDDGKIVSYKVDETMKIYKLLDHFIPDHDNISYYLIYINKLAVQNVNQTVKNFSNGNNNLIRFQKITNIQFTLFTVNNLVGEIINLDIDKNEDFLKLLNINSDNNSYFIFNSNNEELNINNKNYKKIIRKDEKYYLVQYPSSLSQKFRSIDSLASKELTLLYNELIQYLQIKSTDLQQLLCIFNILDEHKKLKKRIFKDFLNEPFIPLSFAAKSFILNLDTQFFHYRCLLIFICSLPAFTKIKTDSFIDMFDQLFQMSIEKVDINREKLNDDNNKNRTINNDDNHDANDHSKISNNDYDEHFFESWPFMIYNSYEFSQLANIPKGVIIHINNNNIYCNFREKSKTNENKFTFFDPLENKEFEFIQKPRRNLKDIFYDINNVKKFKRQIGEGSYGKVRIFTNINNENYAAKMIKIRSPYELHDQKALMREILILNKLNHPSIVKFLGIYIEFNQSALQPIIFTEYIRKGNLYKLLFPGYQCKKIKLTPTQKYILLLGISHAMCYLHKNGVLHRDLKLSNILIDENLFPKICDFGLSRCFPGVLERIGEAEMSGRYGTNVYMSPEMLSASDNDPDPIELYTIDVYAFSIVAIQILTEEKAYSEFDNDEQISFYLYNLVLDGERPRFTDDVTKKMRKLLSKCWSGNPSERPTFEQIYNELLSNSTEYIKGEINKGKVGKYINLLNTASNPSDLCVLNKIFIHESETDKIFFNIDDYKNEEEPIASDRYNDIYKAQSVKNDDKNEYFARICKMDGISNYRLMVLIRESLILKKINHPLITKFIGFNFQSFNGDSCFQPTMLFEYLPNGSLYDILNRKNKKIKWDITNKAITILGIANAMAHIHDKGITHGSLNPKNILFDENFYPKIKFPQFFTDMIIYGEFSGYEMKYIAPELSNELNKINFALENDVYAFAIIVYEILDRIIIKMRSNKLRNSNTHDVKRPPFSENITPQMNQLISQCWSVDMNQRPTFAQIFMELSNDLSYFGDGININEINRFLSYLNSSPS